MIMPLVPPADARAEMADVPTFVQVMVLSGVVPPTVVFHGLGGVPLDFILPVAVVTTSRLPLLSTIVLPTG
jgi:hypothetical protein